MRGETSPVRVVTTAVPGGPRGPAPPEARARREARTRVARARREPASVRTELVSDATGLIAATTAAMADVMTGARGPEARGAASGLMTGAMTGARGPEARGAASGLVTGAMTGERAPEVGDAASGPGADPPVQRRPVPLAVDGVTRTEAPAKPGAGGRVPRSAAAVRD